MIQQEQRVGFPSQKETPGRFQQTIRQVQHLGKHPLAQLVICALVALAFFLPHLNTPPMRDEADYIAAAQAINHLGVPVFYQSDGLLVGQLIKTGSVPGLPGISKVYPSADGYETRVENGGVVYKVGNFHPPLYLYLLAVFFLLPLSFTIAARLLNFLLLLAALALIHRIVAFFVTGDSEGEAAPVLKRVTTSLLPMVACLAFLFFPYGIQSYTLIDSTSTISPLAVLVFWYAHLRAPLNGKGVLWRALALLLVIWSNMGPVPTLLLTVLALPLLRCEKRRVIIAASSVGLALVLFALTYEAYSLWAGIPLSATLAHSSAALARPLALLPHLPNAAHLNGGTNTLPEEVLLLVLFGPLCAGAALLVVLRYSRWYPNLRWLLPVCIGGGLVLALVLASVYLKWQHVSIKQGLTTWGIAWLPAAIKLMLLNWQNSPAIGWFFPGLTCTLLLATARLRTRSHQQVVEMAVWSLIMAFDILLVGSPAWGFPKYMGPVYALFVPLGVLFLSGLWTGQVTLARWPTLAVSGIGIVALGWALPFTVATCQATPNACLPDVQESFILWGSMLAALCLLIVMALLALNSGWSWSHLRPRWENHQVGTLVLVVLLPLVIFALLDQGHLLTTQGPVTYDTGGDITGIVEAGHYLASHVAPGQLVVARKDLMLYVPGVHYIDDSIAADVNQLPATVWVVRPQFSFPGFVEVARIGAWGIYYRAPIQVRSTGRDISVVWERPPTPTRLDTVAG